MIEGGGPQAVRAQSRHELDRGLSVEHPVPVLTAEVAHQVVNGESEADLQRGVRVLVINRQQERNRAREVRRQPHQQPPLLARFADQLEAQLLEVAQPAVDQLGRPAGRAAGEIARFHQRDFQTAQSRLTRGRGALDASTDNREVEGCVAEGLKIPFHGSAFGSWTQPNDRLRGCRHNRSTNKRETGMQKQAALANVG